MVWQFASVFFHAFPPHVTVVGQCDVGEDHVLVQTGHAVGVGVEVGAGGDAKVTRFWVNSVELAVRVRLDPSDVVTDGGHFPAFEALRWYQHGEIGFAASAGESRRHMVFFALWIGHAQDEHVLGQPALVASHIGGDAQSKTFLAQQSIATVARTVRPNLAGFWVVHDVFGFVTRPFHISLAGGQRCAHRMHARYKSAVGADHVINCLAHAGHDALVDCHVGAVREFNADVGNV